ncbi:hypothetical protein KTE45_02995 [Burkholderia multivorans]|uniref:hypothetical protein n=1 Tax=Burkholderia multivorans TaxID=87883 RepID=UPI001C2747BA|nr:hypothetical protein [Burkholderia multivorans]MBU9517426.1 hypothetical protein [Burkholderia multivorans]
MRHARRQWRSGSVGFVAGGLLQLAGFVRYVQFGAAVAIALVTMTALRCSGLERKQ